MENAYKLPNGTVIFEPCPFPQLYDAVGKLVFEQTKVCPRCYEGKRRFLRFDCPVHTWQSDLCIHCGVQKNEDNQRDRCKAALLGKLKFEEYLKHMEQDSKNESLQGREIIEAQLAEEGIFNLLVQDMDLDKLEQHYNDLKKMIEVYRVKALKFRQLKMDWDIERLNTATDEDRAAFDEAKKRKRAELADKKPVAAAIRQNREEKMVNSFADKMMVGNPNLSREDAVARARKMLA
jgi:hypothetical protein